MADGIGAVASCGTSLLPDPVALGVEGDPEVDLAVPARRLLEARQAAGGEDEKAIRPAVPVQILLRARRLAASYWTTRSGRPCPVVSSAFRTSMPVAVQLVPHVRASLAPAVDFLAREPSALEVGPDAGLAVPDRVLLLSDHLATFVVHPQVDATRARRVDLLPRHVTLRVVVDHRAGFALLGKRAWDGRGGRRQDRQDKHGAGARRLT